jgi:hypothetical protein
MAAFFLNFLGCHSDDLIAQTVETGFVRFGQVLLDGNVSASEPGNIALKIPAKITSRAAMIYFRSPFADFSEKLCQSALAISSLAEPMVSKPTGNASGQSQNKDFHRDLWPWLIATLLIGAGAYSHGRHVGQNQRDRLFSITNQTQHLMILYDIYCLML